MFYPLSYGRMSFRALIIKSTLVLKRDKQLTSKALSESRNCTLVFLGQSQRVQINTPHHLPELTLDIHLDDTKSGDPGDVPLSPKALKIIAEILRPEKMNACLKSRKMH